MTVAILASVNPLPSTSTSGTRPITPNSSQYSSLRVQQVRVLPVLLLTLLLVIEQAPGAVAFTPVNRLFYPNNYHLPAVTALRSSSESHTETSSSTTTITNHKPIPKKTPSKTASLGLLTFDLDDTLYPIAPVIREANAAFARAMENFGYGMVQPGDIVQTGRKIREEIAATDPQRAAILTHTEIRRMAIRREMETITLERKLKATADDWATPVSDLSPIVVNHAKK